uniref:Ig-like domain-containing protein n=1 Tax=Poecilia latipinna TaxID=48699 RepID=A0A3B3TYU4_9TELE
DALHRFVFLECNALQREKFCQHEGFCVTFNEGEIKAEVGLCAVIPCAFTSLFAPEYIIWYKCEPLEAKCDNSDPVFHSGKNKENIQPEYEGRMSLLNLNMTQKNCSIMINDLKKSDSGWYQLRVEGKETKDAYTYLAKANLSLTGLSQKPSVMIPPLTEGQQVTLTCTAPDSHIIGNTTALKTENLTAFTQRHVSTLTFNYSADHHNTSITCKVSFTGGITTEETVTLNVTCDKSNLYASLIRETCLIQTVLHRNPNSPVFLYFTVNHVKHCACGGGALPWVVAGVSLSVHLFSMIYLYHVW